MNFVQHSEMLAVDGPSFGAVLKNRDSLCEIYIDIGYQLTVSVYEYSIFQLSKCCTSFADSFVDASVFMKLLDIKLHRYVNPAVLAELYP